jgi:hypothetical protein
MTELSLLFLNDTFWKIPSLHTRPNKFN